MTTFIVDGQEKVLTYDVNGIDISGDFIGNTFHGMEINDEGHYIASQDDYQWWIDTIAKHEAMDQVILDYKAKFDSAEVDEVVEAWASGDYETDPDQVKMGLERELGELS